MLTVWTVTPELLRSVVSALGEMLMVLMAAVGFVVVMTMLITRLPATAVTEIDEVGMPSAVARALMKAAWLKSETVPARVSCCVTCGMYAPPGGAGDGGGGDGGGGDGAGGGGDGGGGEGEGGRGGGGKRNDAERTQTWFVAPPSEPLPHVAGDPGKLARQHAPWAPQKPVQVPCVALQPAQHS